MEHSIHFRTKTAAPKRLWVLRILIYLAGIIILAFGITLNTKTGLGASLTVGMKIVPNPADGFASVLGQKLKKGFGFGKNIFDLSCLAIALILGIVFAGKLLGIGAGTVIAMLLTGRVVALCQAKLYRLYEKLTA